MKRNISKKDKTIRLIIIVVIAVLGLFNEFPVGLASALAMISILLLVTVLINFSPLYRLLGISTYNTQE